MMTDRAEIETLLREAGLAINLLAGKCAFAERVLCKATTLCVELLAGEDEREYSERMHRENDPHVIGDDEVCGGHDLDDDYEPGECPHCGGTGEQLAGGVLMECPECGGYGDEC